MDILHANPYLDFYGNNFILKDSKKVIDTEFCSIAFCPGYICKFIKIEDGNYLNVLTKNKILLRDTILDFLNDCKAKKLQQHKIKDLLIGRKFKTSYSKKYYRIDDILFDRNPINSTFNFEGKTLNLKEYYKIRYHIEIKDLKQPLIKCKKNSEIFYAIPELCYLIGFDDNLYQDKNALKKLSDLTASTPTDRINTINEFLKLLVATKRNENIRIKLSSKAKYDYYGIEIKPLIKMSKAYYMKETELLDDKKQTN